MASDSHNGHFRVNEDKPEALCNLPKNPQLASDKGRTCTQGCLALNPRCEPPGFNTISFSHPQVVGAVGGA